MDVLIITVGMSLLTQLITTDGPLTAHDSEVLVQHQYASVSNPTLDDVLMRARTYFSLNPSAVAHANELIAVRKYAHRMTGHAQLVLPHTDYVLVVPNTLIGRFCAEHLKSALCAHVVDAYVTILHIEGLQRNDCELLDHGWERLRDALDHIHRHYKSDVIYNITGDFALFAGLIHGYVSNRGVRIMYTFHAHAPLVLIDVNPTGAPADISFYQDADAVV